MRNDWRPSFTVSTRIVDRPLTMVAGALTRSATLLPVIRPSSGNIVPLSATRKAGMNTSAATPTVPSSRIAKSTASTMPVFAIGASACSMLHVPASTTSVDSTTRTRSRRPSERMARGRTCVKNAHSHTA